MLLLFQCRYIKKMTWFQIEGEMCISEKVRKGLRGKLVSKGARFIGMDV